MGKSSLLMRTVKAGARSSARRSRCSISSSSTRSRRPTPTCSSAGSRRRSPSSSSCPTPSTSSWDSGFSNPQNCTRYVERHILQPLDAPCVIAIDETDSIFRTTFSADFFAMLRSWHGLRAHPVRRSWKNLDIILSTSTEPQFFIDGRTSRRSTSASCCRSRISCRSRSRRLNALHPRPLGDADVQRLYALVGGHPYLTRKALYMVASSAPTLHRRRALRAGHRGHRAVRRSPALLPAAAAGEARADLGAAPDDRAAHGGGDELLIHRLQAAGLVRREGNKVVPRCDLYARYFSERLHEQG